MTLLLGAALLAAGLVLLLAVLTRTARYVRDDQPYHRSHRHHVDHP